MRKLRRFAGILFATVLVMSTFTACGNDGGGAAGGGDVWRIGGIGPTTGGAAIFGIAVSNGAQLAVEEINAAGGINGYQIELNFQDDQHDAERSVNAYNTLKDWGMQILLGPVTSTPAIAVVEEAYKDGMFMLTPSATAIAAIARPNAFRVCFSDPNQGKASAEYMAKYLGVTQVAVIYDSSDAYSSGIFETFAAKAPELGINIVAAEAFTESSNTDFSVQLQNARNAGAELLFLPFYYQEAALVLQQLAAMEWSPLIFSCDGMDGILDVEGFDPALAEGVMFLAPFAATATDDVTVAFVNAFQERFNEIPNQFAANSYDAIHIIKAAIEHANLTPSMSVSEIGDGMIQAMLEITMDGVTFKQGTWTADGEPDKEPMVVQIRGGVYYVLSN